MYETPLKYIYVLFPHENIISVKPTERSRKKIRKLYHEYSLCELQLCTQTSYYFKPGLAFEKKIRFMLFNIKTLYNFYVFRYLE